MVTFSASTIWVSLSHGQARDNAIRANTLGTWFFSKEYCCGQYGTSFINYPLQNRGERGWLPTCGLSLKSEMKFHFCWGGKMYFFTGFNGLYLLKLYSLNSFSFKWRYCSLVILKSLWQKPVLTTHLSWNHLWGYYLCNALKHTLTMNRTKYRPSQST
jgi:hypothetical protein